MKIVQESIDDKKAKALLKKGNFGEDNIDGGIYVAISTLYDKEISALMGKMSNDLDTLISVAAEKLAAEDSDIDEDEIRSTLLEGVEDRDIGDGVVALLRSLLDGI